MDHQLLARAASDDWSYYAYNPSFVLPIVCVGLYAVCFIAHLTYMIKTKAYYLWPFTLGVFGEAMGYVFRRISAAHPKGRQQGLIWYLMQSLFIILAPALMAASHYMAFGRLIAYVGEQYSPVRAKRVTLIFVVFDVISFVVQGGGGSLYSSDNVKLYSTAKGILVAGFLIQIISFGIFGVFAILYQVRARRAGEPAGPWTKLLYTLYLGCGFILIRGIFRTIEFGSGSNNHGYLLEREGWYYGLETLPILLCTVLFLVSHPSRYIPSYRSLRLHPAQLSTIEVDGGEEKSTGSVDAGRKKWWKRSARN